MKQVVPLQEVQLVGQVLQLVAFPPGEMVPLAHLTQVLLLKNQLMLQDEQEIEELLELPVDVQIAHPVVQFKQRVVPLEYWPCGHWVQVPFWKPKLELQAVHTTALVLVVLVVLVLLGALQALQLLGQAVQAI